MADPKDYIEEYRSRDTAALWRSKDTLRHQCGEVPEARVQAIDTVLVERGYGPTAEEPRQPEPFEVWLARKFYRHWVNASQRGIEFTLGLEDMRRLLSTTECYYTGMAIDDKAGQEQPHSRTLDRIDASKGYTPDNTVACSNAANTLKNQCFEGASTVTAMTPVQMLRMAQKMIYVRSDDQ